MKQRKRQIDPDFYHNKALAKCKPHTRLLFPGLWQLADREGRLKDVPDVIRGLVFPFEPRLNVDSMLSELAKSRLIVRYKVDDKGYIWICSFKEHQSVHPHECQSVIPAPLDVITSNDMQRQAIHGQYVDVDVDVEVKVDEDVKDKIPFEEIIVDLNARANTTYRPTTKKTRELIRARWREGATLEDFKTVHRKKCDEWLDTDMSKYLRPETLYSPKFEGYLNQPEKRQLVNPMSNLQGEVKKQLEQKYGIKP